MTLKHVDSTQTFKWVTGAAIFFRISLLFALPNLSDDFYRFIWDGNLLAHGMNPFTHTPEFYMRTGLPEFLPTELFQNLNSQAYYSVYPPVNQYIYGFSASLFGVQLFGNAVVMKLTILAAEIGTLWVMMQLLSHYGHSKKWLLVYALNPLIILELTGNLHFEGVMIFFLLLGYYLFIQQRLWTAGLCFLLAVNTKLIPLLLMPYLVFSIGWKKSAGLAGILAAGTLILHFPFLNQVFVNNFTDSLGLYFQSFEFNASLYYLARWVGYEVRGFNMIEIIAPQLAAAETFFIIVLSWIYRKATLINLPVMYMVLLGVYFLFSTTVHPWYVSSLICFVPLGALLFPIAWSAAIPLTYVTYSTSAYTENLWLVAFEYIIVLAAVGYDIYNYKKINNKVRLFSFYPSGNKS